MTIAVEMAKCLAPTFKEFEKKIEIIVDGGYAKDTVLLPLQKLKEGVTITRLRRDARCSKFLRLASRDNGAQRKSTANGST